MYNLSKSTFLKIASQISNLKYFLKYINKSIVTSKNLL